MLLVLMPCSIFRSIFVCLIFCLEAYNRKQAPVVMSTFTNYFIKWLHELLFFFVWQASAKLWLNLQFYELNSICQKCCLGICTIFQLPVLRCWWILVYNWSREILPVANLGSLMSVSAVNVSCLHFSFYFLFVFSDVF